MYNGNLYRPHGQVITIHAVSPQAADRMLKDKERKFGFKVFDRLYVQRNTNCIAGELPEGYHCYFHLVAKPRYDKTPLGLMTPNGPEWIERIIKRKPPEQILKEREKLIERVRKQKDAFGD